MDLCGLPVLDGAVGAGVKQLQLEGLRLYRTLVRMRVDGDVFHRLSGGEFELPVLVQTRRVTDAPVHSGRVLLALGSDHRDVVDRIGHAVGLCAVLKHHHAGICHRIQNSITSLNKSDCLLLTVTLL